jgi:hypothetical protein
MLYYLARQLLEQETDSPPRVSSWRVFVRMDDLDEDLDGDKGDTDLP